MNNFINFASSERLALLGFSYFDYFGFNKIEHLKDVCGSYQQAFAASYSELLNSGLNLNLINRFISWRSSFDFSKSLEHLNREGIKFVSLVDIDYPLSLKEIASPPLVLFYLGDFSLASDVNSYKLAIVGSRKADEYAQQTIAAIVPPLINKQITIISGLARGADAKAHQETLRNRGKTIAVLGTGLDKSSFYPRENLELAEDIIRNSGLLISEFPPGTKAKPINFPRRNRLISGLSQAVLIVQAEEKSGSLITAAYALEQNREVLSIPGNIFCRLSWGTNNLIKDGAKVVTSANDILETYGLNE